MSFYHAKSALPLVLCAALFAGCGDQASVDGPAAKREVADAKKHSGGTAHSHEHDCDHVEKGPHGGQVFELGGAYHAELVHDEKSHRIRIYLLDAEAREPVAIEEQQLVINSMVEGKPAAFELKAAALAGESEGRSSHFESTDETLFHSVIEEHDSKSRLRVSIDGKQFVAEIVPCVEHDHEGEHEHEGEHKH